MRRHQRLELRPAQPAGDTVGRGRAPRLGHPRLLVGLRGGSAARTGAGLFDHGRLLSELVAALLDCRAVTRLGEQTQLKMYGTYPLPGRFFVSGTLQNLAGPAYQATYTATNAEIAPSLGRNLAACGTQAVCNATAAVPLVAPNTLYKPRRTQLDLRLSKTFPV